LYANDACRLHSPKDTVVERACVMRYLAVTYDNTALAIRDWLVSSFLRRKVFAVLTDTTDVTLRSKAQMHSYSSRTMSLLETCTS
jgi:hypothetical protein